MFIFNVFFLPNITIHDKLQSIALLQQYRAYVAFPDFFRNSTSTWWKREIEELHTNPHTPEKSLKFDGLWIVSL